MANQNSITEKRSEDSYLSNRPAPAYLAKAELKIRNIENYFHQKGLSIITPELRGLWKSIFSDVKNVIGSELSNQGEGEIDRRLYSLNERVVDLELYLTHKGNTGFA